MSFARSALAQTPSVRPFSGHYPRGLRLLPELREHIKKRNAAAEEKNEALNLDADLLRSLGKNNPFEPVKKLERSYMALTTPVKNQETCASCWTFGAAGAFEGAYLKFNNKTIAVSAQELLDCSTPFDNNPR
jgi:C1A family cysteine protease